MVQIHEEAKEVSSSDWKGLVKIADLDRILRLFGSHIAVEIIKERRRK